MQIPCGFYIRLLLPSPSVPPPSRRGAHIPRSYATASSRIIPRPLGHTACEVIVMKEKKEETKRAPATPAVPDPPVPNRAHTEMAIGDPPARKEKKEAPPKR